MDSRIAELLTAEPNDQVTHDGTGQWAALFVHEGPGGEILVRQREEGMSVDPEWDYSCFTYEDDPDMMDAWRTFIKAFELRRPAYGDWVIDADMAVRGAYLYKFKGSDTATDDEYIFAQPEHARLWILDKQPLEEKQEIWYKHDGDFVLWDPDAEITKGL